MREEEEGQVAGWSTLNTGINPRVRSDRDLSVHPAPSVGTAFWEPNRPRGGVTLVFYRRMPASEMWKE